jgi:hypothetical protein
VDIFVFSLASPDRSKLEWRVAELPSPKAAAELATLIVCDLGIAPEKIWANWSLEVRDCERRVLSILRVPS